MGLKGKARSQYRKDNYQEKIYKAISGQTAVYGSTVEEFLDANYISECDYSYGSAVLIFPNPDHPTYKNSVSEGVTLQNELMYFVQNGCIFDAETSA